MLLAEVFILEELVNERYSESRVHFPTKCDLLVSFFIKVTLRLTTALNIKTTRAYSFGSKLLVKKEISSLPWFLRVNYTNVMSLAVTYEICLVDYLQRILESVSESSSKVSLSGYLTVSLPINWN